MKERGEQALLAPLPSQQDGFELVIVRGKTGCQGIRPNQSPAGHPAHPGEVLREYLPAGLAIGDAAKRLGVTRQALSALINGRAGVSASMALRLEAALGTSAEFWLAMQTDYDLWQARKRPPKVKRLVLQNEAA